MAKRRSRRGKKKKNKQPKKTHKKGETIYRQRAIKDSVFWEIVGRAAVSGVDEEIHEWVEAVCRYDEKDTAESLRQIRYMVGEDA